MDVPSPRDYQRDAINNISNLYPRENRLLIAHATGLGKGMMPLWIAMKYPHHVRQRGMLFIAHRRKILFQAHDRFQKHFGDEYQIGLEMGESSAVGHEDVIFMSVESVGRIQQQRIRKYDKWDRKFGIVFTDESHHLSEESTWDRVLNFFGVGSDESRHYSINVKGHTLPPLAIHLTATPEDQMAPFVDQMAHSMSVLDGIRQGWLTDIKSYQLGGLDGLESLAAAYDRYLSDDRTLVFASSVDESRRLTGLLNDSGTVNAVHIDASTPKEHREDIYDAFGKGHVKALSNRLVLTEGVDIPSITAILDNAPPSNQRIATQKWGRGVRPHPEADIDSVETAEERKEVIRNSPKPHCKLLCTYDPTETGVTVTQVLTDHEVDIEEDNDMSVEEVVEVIEEFEEERPELDLSRVENFDPSDLSVTETDIFRRTIYNDRLKAFTDLQWVVLDSERVGLWLPKNPFTRSKKYAPVPSVVLFREKGGSVQRKIVSGGYNSKMGFPAAVKASEWQDQNYDSVQDAMERTDSWLHHSARQCYYTATRGNKAQASGNLKEHLRRKDIPVSDDVTDETARLLKADTKIRKKLNKVD